MHVLSIDPDIVHSSNVHTHLNYVEQIMDSVAKLKLGKSDCSQQIFSDNIINGTHRLYIYISLIFSCILAPCRTFIIYNCTDSKGEARES